MFFLGLLIGLIIGGVGTAFTVAHWLGNVVADTVVEVMRDLEEKGHLK